MQSAFKVLDETTLKLWRAANRASAESVELERCGAVHMAGLRRQDAIALRAMARDNERRVQE